MKTLLSLVMTALVVLTSSMPQMLSSQHTIQHLGYTEDYPVIYANELKTIFGDYTLSERTDEHIKGEDCSCGYHQDTIDYYQWIVTYNDVCGQTMECRLNNYESLYYQQLQWMRDQIETHFFTNYVERYFGDRMRSGTYCFCFIGRVCTIARGGNKEDRSHIDACDAYLAALEKSDQLISLSKLNYAEILDRYPIKLSINVKLNDKEIDPDEWASNYSEAVGILHKMTADMSKDIGNGLNLAATVYSEPQHREEAYNTTVRYVRGIPTEMEDYDFEHAIYESYIGEFW